MSDDRRVGRLADVHQRPPAAPGTHLGAHSRFLTTDVLRTCGIRHLTIAPGAASTPVHTHAWEEEFFRVLAGSGTLVTMDDGGTHAYRVDAGDAILHRAGEEAHTLVAGVDGLELLVFGENYPDGTTTLPRSRLAWFHPGWIAMGDDRHPYEIEAALGPPQHGSPEEPRRHVCVVAELPTRVIDREPFGRTERNVGNALGSRSSGLREVSVESGRRSSPRHCHSLEEEFFFVLEGTGELDLGAARHHLEADMFVACPVGAGSTHAITGGAAGIRYLVYSTRRDGDACWYPDSGKLSLRNLGVTFRVEQADYWDGEA